MYTLGINAAFHDSAACLVCDGEVVAAAEDERFTHVKHGKRPIPFTVYELPYHAVHYCLQQAGIGLRDVNHVAYSFNPWLLLDPGRDAEVRLPLEPSSKPAPKWASSPWEPLSLAYVVNAPRQLLSGAPHHLGSLWEGAAPDDYQWHFVEHHLAHAASAFYASPYDRAAVLTLDGRGEKATTSYYRGEGSELELLGQVDMPHSLGLLYEDVTRYLGFLHSSDEYKVMALASFGRPIYADVFREIVQPEGNGSYRINPPRLVERFGPPRPRGGAYDQKHYDIAQSLQKVLEERVLELVHWLHRASSCEKLCLAGGVALNCVMNARLRDLGPFREIWVQPAAGDAGTALGAALIVDARSRGASRRCWTMSDAYLGPQFSDGEIEDFIKWTGVPYRRLKNPAQEAAELLVQDKIIGWFQGRMEFGPRALGARSILASPLHPEMQDRLNEIKDREDFRPVAPVVLEDKAGEWFSGCKSAPFMLFVFDVLPDRAHQIPAVRHVDGTARVQTINRQQHPLYYEVIREFEKRTGVPVLVNTSFNTRGEPIVCTPRDAIECYWTSPLDALIIGSFALEKRR